MQETIEIKLDMQASATKRFINYFIDTIVFLVLSIPFFVVINLLGLPLSAEDPLSWVLMWLLYYFLTELILQRTIGKYITGTKIVTADGLRPGIVKIIIRTFMRLIPFRILSIDEKKLGMFWRDTASGIYVIDAKKYKQALALKGSFEQIGIQEI